MLPIGHPKRPRPSGMRADSPSRRATSSPRASGRSRSITWSVERSDPDARGAVGVGDRSAMGERPRGIPQDFGPTGHRGRNPHPGGGLTASTG